MNSCQFDALDMKLLAAARRAKKIRVHQLEFEKQCARKAAGFRDRKTVPASHHQATPHRGVRAAVRTALAHNSLQHCNEFPSISMGLVGLRKPAVTKMLRSRDQSELDFSIAQCDPELVAGSLGRLRAVEVSDIMDRAMKQPKDSRRRSASSSDTDTTAPEHVSESESRGSLEATLVEEAPEQLHAGERVGALGPLETSCLASGNVAVGLQQREDLLRSVVVQLQSQRTDVEKENARLQQELLVKDSLLTAAKSGLQQPLLAAADSPVQQPQLCLKQAKQIERQRAHKQNKQTAHQRSLRRQKEAELCKMRQEIEEEKVSMLAAAEKELMEIKACVKSQKSQSRVLRQKRRRAVAEHRLHDAENPTEMAAPLAVQDVAVTLTDAVPAVEFSEIPHLHSMNRTNSCQLDPLDMKLLAAERRAKKIRIHQQEFQRSCARKAAGFRDRNTEPVSHHQATPHRGVRAAIRTALARNSLQHCAEFPSLSMGRVGLRKPAVTKMLRSRLNSDFECSAGQTETELVVGSRGTLASVKVSDIVDEASNQPQVSGKRPVSSSDADTTASQISEPESRGSLDATASMVELEETVEQIQAAEKAEEFVSPVTYSVESGNATSEVQHREDLLRSVVVQLRSQRTDVEKENARLQQELLVKDSLLTAAKSGLQQPLLSAADSAVQQPQLCLKQAKQIERQRAHKQNKQAAHQRSLRQQKEAELFKVREEIEKEKASMLAAAEKELSAIKARVKSQGRALRQKRRRAVGEEHHAENPTQLLQAPSLEQDSATQVAPHHAVSMVDRSHALADLPVEEHVPEGKSRCKSEEEDAVSSVESAEFADSCQEDMPGAMSQCISEEDGEAVDEDWQVLSEGSDDDEAVWDLIG